MMKKIYPILFFLILFSACQKYDDLVPEFETRTISPSQSDLIESFSGLTNNDASACNLILDKEDIPDILCNILINIEKGSEVVFLVDNTGSMSDDIDEVKKNINEILNCLPDGVRIGAGTYADNMVSSDWYTSIDLTENIDSIRLFINGISVSGGGDIPESVFDAIWKTLDEFSWKDCEAPDIIIVMGDAEPKTGSGSNHTVEEVVAKAESLCSNTKFVPVIILDI